jgi:outer membrane protein assembly factor BamB
MKQEQARLTRRHFCQTASAGLFAATFALPSPADEGRSKHEWPQFQGGPGHAGWSPDETIRPPFKLLWSYRLDGDASGDAGGGVTVGGGLVFVSVLNTRSLVALDADTGRLRWEYADTYPGYKDVPSYSSGRLLLWERTKKPRVLALEAATGKVLWQQPLQDVAHLAVLTRGGLAVEQGRVYCSEGGEEPAVLALDEKTGKQLWRVGLGKESGAWITPPSVARGRLFVAVRSASEVLKAERGAVIALDPDNGKEIWRRPDVPTARPLFTDGDAIACTLVNNGQSQFHLLDAATGKTRWTLTTWFGLNPPTASLTREHVLVKPYGGRFTIHDRATGRQLGQFDGRTGSGCCTPTIAGQYAYLGTSIFSLGDRENLASFQLIDAPREKGHGTSLHAIDLTTGKSVWFFGTGNTVCGDPAIAYGRIYCTSRDGRVYCFAPAGPGEPTTPEARDTSAPAPPERIRPLLAPERTDRVPEGKAWPMAGGSPERAGLPGVKLNLPLQPAWQFDTGGRVLCSAALRDGMVFTGSDAGKILALAADSGKRAWEFAAGAPVRCTPAVAGGMVYCGADSGRFHALDASTGKERWHFVCGGPVQSSPAVVGGVVVFGASDHHVYCLDRDTGRKLWAFRIRDYCIQALVVIHGMQVFAAQWQDWLWALDLATGKEQWRSFIPVSIEAVAFHQGKLYARSPYYIIELDPAAGKRLRIVTASYGYGGLAFMKDLLFQSGVLGQYGHSGATVTDLSQAGEEMKQPIPTLEGVRRLASKGLPSAPDRASMVAPLVLGDAVCFAGRTGKVALTDAAGKQLWSTTLGGQCHSAPAAAAGLLVVGCDDGRVYAFQAR